MRNSNQRINKHLLNKMVVSLVRKVVKVRVKKERKVKLKIKDPIKRNSNLQML